MEKAGRVLMVESAFDWDDVGSWTAMAKYLSCDAANNTGNCELRAIESGGNLIYSTQQTLIGLIGVQDLIVVQTADALLICNRHEAEKIKHLVAQVPPGMQ